MAGRGVEARHLEFANNVSAPKVPTDSKTKTNLPANIDRSRYE